MNATILPFPDSRRFDDLKLKPGESCEEYVTTVVKAAFKWQKEGYLSATAIYLEAAARHLQREAIRQTDCPVRRRRGRPRRNAPEQVLPTG
jgi:hypothetical protein